MSEQEASAGVSTTDNKKEAESAQVSAEAETDKAKSSDVDIDAKQDESATVATTAGADEPKTAEKSEKTPASNKKKKKSKKSKKKSKKKTKKNKDLTAASQEWPAILVSPNLLFLCITLAFVKNQEIFPSTFQNEDDDSSWEDPEEAREERRASMMCEQLAEARHKLEKQMVPAVGSVSGYFFPQLPVCISFCRYPLYINQSQSSFATAGSRVVSGGLPGCWDSTTMGKFWFSTRSISLSAKSV